MFHCLKVMGEKRDNFEKIMDYDFSMDQMIDFVFNTISDAIINRTNFSN